MACSLPFVLRSRTDVRLRCLIQEPRHRRIDYVYSSGYLACGCCNLQWLATGYWLRRGVEVWWKHTNHGRHVAFIRIRGGAHGPLCLHDVLGKKWIDKETICDMRIPWEGTNACVPTALRPYLYWPYCPVNNFVVSPRICCEWDWILHYVHLCHDCWCTSSYV